ncbi:hypothetical protein KKD52_17205 [Myxococcota bacterium]|nr:hypothetical protein [Myxococcota bacterium]MBU1512093.1 hypothetical protein [Myxococcota bacterium]
MEWDLMLEKLRRECFRPTVPPPVRMPRWAVAALMGAGLTLAGAACDRGGSGGPPPAPEMGTMAADDGRPMPPGDPVPPDMNPVPAYAVAMPPDPIPPYGVAQPPDAMPPQVPDSSIEYRAPPVEPPDEKPVQMKIQMKSESPAPDSAPMYGIPPHLRSMTVDTPRPAYTGPRVPPPGPKMYGAPPMGDME